jgi:hypothetical protein
VEVSVERLAERPAGFLGDDERIDSVRQSHSRMGVSHRVQLAIGKLREPNYEIARETSPGSRARGRSRILGSVPRIFEEVVMFLTVESDLGETRDFCFALSGLPSPDLSYSQSSSPTETRRVFIHRRAVRPADWPRMRRGARVRCEKVIAEHGRGLRAEGVVLVS